MIISSLAGTRAPSPNQGQHVSPSSASNRSAHRGRYPSSRKRKSRIPSASTPSAECELRSQGPASAQALFTGRLRAHSWRCGPWISGRPRSRQGNTWLTGGRVFRIIHRTLARCARPVRYACRQSAQKGDLDGMEGQPSSLTRLSRTGRGPSPKCESGETRAGGPSH